MTYIITLISLINSYSTLYVRFETIFSNFRLKDNCYSKNDRLLAYR